MKKLTLGIVIGLIIGLSGSSFAAIGQAIEATFAKFSIFVDGVEQKLDADPIVYQGTAYVPLRVFANMLGKDVTYSGSERKIDLNTPIANRTKPSEKEANTNVKSDFRNDPPELIRGTIFALKADLERTTDPDKIEYYELLISERLDHLHGLGLGLYDLEIADLENKIMSLKHSINNAIELAQQEGISADAVENMEQTITDLQSKLSDLEAQKAALESKN